MTEPTSLSERVARAVYDELPNRYEVTEPNTAGGYDRVMKDDPWEDAPDRHKVCLSQARAAIRTVLEGIMEADDKLLAIGTRSVKYPALDRFRWQAMIRHIIERECGE